MPKFLQPLGMKGIAAIVAILAVSAAVLVGVFVNGGFQQGFEFSQNQRISATSEMRITFPEIMDKNSVEENIIPPTGLQAKSRWEADSLVYTPAQKLEAGKTYLFHVSRRAMTAEGKQLGRDLEYRFIVAGAPAISTFMPSADAKGIPAQARITLVFDRPIAALAQVQGVNTFTGWPVTITPPVAGRWRWLGTTTAEFEPEKGLTLGTKYTVNVPVGLQTVTGEKTEKDFSWSFETQRPSVEGIDPAMGTKLAGPTTEVVLRFSQEMSLENVRKNVQLEAVGENSSATPLTIKNVVFGKSENEKGQKVTDKKLVVLQPAAKLNFNAGYRVTVNQGTLGAEGDLGLETQFTSSFATVGALSIERATYNEGNLSILFSNPMDSESLKQNIQITPEPTNWKEYSFEVYEWTNFRELSFYPSLKPSTEYRVTIKKSIKDRFGQMLAAPYEFSFKTPALPPEAFIHSKGEFGIFERGKPPVFYLNAVNINRMQVEMSKLSFQQFLKLQNDRRTNYEYAFNVKDGQEYKQWVVRPPKDIANQWESIPFDVQEKSGQSMGPGIYALSMQSPEYVQTWGNGKPIVQYQFFALTDMALTLKHGASKAMVWVTNMQTGAPISGATVTFHSLSGKELLSAKSDAQGFVEVPFDIAKFITSNNEWDTQFWVSATNGDDFAFVSSDWNDGYRPYQFGNIYEERRGYDAGKFRMLSYVYTERPLYKAGDTVNFKGIVRLLDWDGGLHLPSPETRSMAVTINDAEGREVYSKTVKLTAYGTFNGDFTTASGASLGGYYLNARLTPETDVPVQYAGTSFSVLAYRKPEYKVEVTPESEDMYNGQQYKARVLGSYYFGAPMTNAKVEWRAQTTDYFFNKYQGDGWYSFALEDAWCWYDCSRSESSLTSGEGSLDAAGSMDLSFPVNIDDKGVSQVVSVDVDITDQNNQVVSTRSSVIVHKAKAYVGVGIDDYIVTPGKDAGVRVLTVDTEGKPLPGQNVSLKLYLREWNTIRKKGVDGQYYYDNEPKDTLEKEWSETTGSDGKTLAKVRIPVGGEHRIVASVKDADGRETKAATNVYAWSETYVNWSHDNNDRIDVETDKPEYKVGDTAKLLVKTPFQGKGVRALVTVERENILRKEVIDITSNAMPVEVKITEDMVPNAYVSVVVIKPREGETFNEFGLDTGVPAFKIGYASLRINTADKKLNVTLKTDKDRYGPREKVTVSIRTTDANGKPVPAELSLGVVDLSLLALTGFEKPDLVSMFYANRGLGVMTSQMLSQLVERFKPGSKGGGGGESPDTVKRGNFKDTAFWLPTVVTNADGNATVSFTLPDNLTTWQLLSIGATQQHTFGADAMTILETKKVILRPVRPRFALTDDEVKLGAIVHNFTAEEQHFKVTLTGKNFDHLGPQEKDITVAKDGQVKVIFPVKIGPDERALFTFKAENAAGVDEVEESIPVYKFGVPQANATFGDTEDVVTERVLIPTKEDAQHGSVSVSVSPTVATYLPEGLAYLATYPYGCAEQTASSFLPNVALSRLQGFDAFSFVDGKTLERNVSAGLQRLYGFQRQDGGFGYWENSERSYPYLTAYILYALQLTKNNGYTVDGGVIDRAVSYMQDELRNSRSEYMDNNTRAYALFVLAEVGRSVDVSLLNNLYEKRSELATFSKAQLAMAYAKSSQKRKAADLLAEVMNSVIVDKRGAHFEEDSSRNYGWMMHTDTLTTATVMQALVRIQPENDMLPKMARYLLDVRQYGRWDTTQSTSISLLAFAEYLDLTKELEGNMTAAVELRGKKSLEQEFNAKNILQRKEISAALAEFVPGKETDVKIGKQGKGKLYYDVVLKYIYTPDRIEPAEEGIGILREMTPLTKADATMAAGTMHKVTLTVTVPEWRNFVAVESPLPAGMEAIDFQLKTTQQDLADTVNTPPADGWSWNYYWNGIWRFNHIEFRDDQVFLFADELPPGVYKYEYLVRATTPGKFHLRPARAWEMYYPETFGQTAGDWMEIRE